MNFDAYIGVAATGRFGPSGWFVSATSSTGEVFSCHGSSWLSTPPQLVLKAAISFLRKLHGSDVEAVSFRVYRSDLEGMATNLGELDLTEAGSLGRDFSRASNRFNVSWSLVASDMLSGSCHAF